MTYRRKSVVAHRCTAPRAAAFAWALALAPAPGLATLPAPFQELEGLRRAATELARRETAGTYARVRVEAGRLDPRLRLPRCGQPLKAQRAPGGRWPGRAAVAVACPGPRAWKVYVPVTVRVWERVVVAARPLPRGAALAPQDLRLEEREVTSRLRGYFRSLEAVRGRLLRTALPQGAVLEPGLVRDPPLVRRGQPVTLVAGRPGLEVRMAGTALQDGARDQVVAVRNNRSRRLVRGRVVAPGLVRVDL